MNGMVAGTEQLAPKLDEYTGLLRQLPFLTDVRVLTDEHPTPAQARWASRASLGAAMPRATLSLKTLSGRTYELHCFFSEQPVHVQSANFYLDRIETASDSIVLAPYVGPTAARLFSEKHLNFVDLLGNCYLRLGEQYLAKFEKAGTPPSKPAAGRGLRVSAYRVLFALLIKPSAIAQTTRSIAELAGGVSPQTAADLRAKLQSRGLILKRGTDYRWAPGGFQRALELFVHGFSTTLAPSLELGRYRARQNDLGELTAALAPGLMQLGRWAFGGGAAVEQLNGYYRGERTIVYLEQPPTNPLKQLGLVPDTKGRVVLMRSPGPLAFESPHEHVVHPLLAYVDLLAEEHERANEAARVLYSDFLVAHEDAV